MFLINLVRRLEVPEVSSSAVGLWRALFCIVSLAFLPESFVRGYIYVNSELLQPNLFGLPILFTSMPNPHFFDLLILLLKVTLVFACIGLFTRASLFIVALIFFYLSGIFFSLGGWDHSTGIAALSFLVLATSKHGHEFSVDHILFGNKKSSPSTLESSWPIVINRWLLSILFFSAGVKKLTLSGLDWVFSDHMANLLQGVHNPEFAKLLYYVASKSWLCQAIAGGTILFELLAPLALFGGVWRAPIAVGQVLFLITVSLVLREQFWPMYAVMLCWLPFESMKTKKCVEAQV